ncbi:MAG: 4Fe-4S binding protein, partial [Candidatus Cloacimonadaceae bacterium]
SSMTKSYPDWPTQEGDVDDDAAGPHAAEHGARDEVRRAGADDQDGADVCPVNALSMEGDKAVCDEATCIDCGACISTCPVQAISE